MTNPKKWRRPNPKNYNNITQKMKTTSSEYENDLTQKNEDNLIKKLRRPKPKNEDDLPRVLNRIIFHFPVSEGNNRVDNNRKTIG